LFSFMFESSTGTSHDPGHDQDHAHARHHHKRKRKHSHRNRIPRQAIIGLLFLLACLIAFSAWHFLVQDIPARSSAPPGGAQTRIKA